MVSFFLFFFRRDQTGFVLTSTITQTTKSPPSGECAQSDSADSHDLGKENAISSQLT
jgi:hypothetical protein